MQKKQEHIELENQCKKLENLNTKNVTNIQEVLFQASKLSLEQMRNLQVNTNTPNNQVSNQYKNQENPALPLISKSINFQDKFTSFFKSPKPRSISIAAMKEVISTL